MNFITKSSCIFTICCFTGVYCIVVERYYKSAQNITSNPNAKYQVVLTKRSKIECGIACREENSCTSFSFEKKTRSCRMSSLITENISDRVYYTDMVCPSELGYTAWNFPDMTLCLKYVPIGKPNQEAVDSCKGDGAHLALIDSDNTRIHIRDILSNLGAAPGFIYFDGHDVKSQDIFETWKGDALWTSWASNNPAKKGSTQDCITGKSDDGYLTRDALCTYTFPYFCQIDNLA